MNHIDTVNSLENQYTYTTTLSLEECQNIVEWITEENKKNGKHMLEKQAEELFIQAKEYWCCCVKDNNKLIWCVFLMGVEKWWTTLYEWWSIFVEPSYRMQWIGYILTQKILEMHPDIPIYAITNVVAVQKNNTKLQQYIYTKDILPKEILEILEVPWALLENDTIYCNEILHTLIQTHA